MRYDRPEDTPGYGGLYDEVVTEDCYGLRSVGFVPDVVVDLGANIGVFARYAREMFPAASIVCVEPNPDNFDLLRRHVPVPPVTIACAAVGRGRVRRFLGAANGAHESYVSPGLGFDEPTMAGCRGITSIPTGIETAGDGFELFEGDLVMPDLVLAPHAGRSVLLKMDIEGGENAVLTDAASMAALATVDYLAAEIHFYALTGDVLEPTRLAIEAALGRLESTHECSIDGVNFRARRRGLARVPA